MFGLEMAFDCSEVEELSPYALYEMETLEMCDGIHVVEFHLRRFSILNTVTVEIKRTQVSKLQESDSFTARFKRSD